MKLRPGDLILTTHVIYKHPTDYPNHFVVREWAVVNGISTPVPGSDIVLVDTLEEARKAIPLGRHRINRSKYDVKSIVEMWVA